MSKYRTIDVWNEFYGRKESVYDYAGRLSCGAREVRSPCA